MAKIKMLWNDKYVPVTVKVEEGVSMSLCLCGASFVEHGDGGSARLEERWKDHLLVCPIKEKP
jgi:hypothetical protein